MPNARPVPHTVTIEARCANCGKPIRAGYEPSTGEVFNWYHADSGWETCRY